MEVKDEIAEASPLVQPLIQRNKTRISKIKFLFSEIVKGETNISCVKNRHFKLSKYVSNL